MEITEKFEIKVFILFLLKNIKEPMDYNTVSDIVVQDGFVNFFDFAECFGELVEAGQIEEHQGGDCTYTISPSGEEAVSNVELRLFNSVREQALRSALRLLAFRKSGNRIQSSLEPKSGGYSLLCSITDNEKTIMSVELYLTEERYAEKLRANFDENAENMYKGVLAMFSGDVNYIFDE